MSRELANAHGVAITSFAGGVNRGPCVQIDLDDAPVTWRTIQLTRTQAEFVRDVLSKWLGDKKLPPLDPHTTDAGDAF